MGRGAGRPNGRGAWLSACTCPETFPPVGGARPHTHTHARVRTHCAHTQGTSENCVLGMGGGGDFFHYLLILLCLLSLSLSFFLKFSLKDVKRWTWRGMAAWPCVTPLSMAFCGLYLVRLFCRRHRPGRRGRANAGGLRHGPGAPRDSGAGGLCLQMAGWRGPAVCVPALPPLYTVLLLYREIFLYLQCLL